MSQKSIVLVAMVSIINDNKVLMIQESKPSIKGKWNFPSGRLEQGEDLLLAAIREVKEETGLDVNLIHTTGVYNFVSFTNDQVLLFHFIGEEIGGSLTINETEILDAKWLPVHELLTIDQQALREPDLINQIIAAILDGQVYPLSIFKSQLTS